MSSFFSEHPILRPAPLAKTTLDSFPDPQPLPGRLDSTIAPLAGKAPPRAMWLDAFRGFVMLCLISRGFGIPHLHSLPGMSFVAYQFDHTRWVGWTVWDFVQPFFMFIVGLSMPFAFAARRGKGGTWASGLPHALKRTALLLLWSHIVSLAYSTKGWDWELINVLGQLSFTYLIAYLVIDLHWSLQGLTAAVLLAGHWALYQFWPGNSGTNYGQWDMQHNFGEWLDLAVFHKTWNNNYVTINFMSSASATIAGVMAGNLLRGPMHFAGKFAVLLLTGLLLVAGGLVLSGQLRDIAANFHLQLNSHLTDCQGWIPMNKHIWTASFALFSVGVTLWALLLFYTVHAAWPNIPWKPLVVMGANCIFLYIVSQLFHGKIAEIWRNLAGSGIAWVLSLMNAPIQWLGAVLDWLWLGTMMTMAWFLYNRKVFIKL